MSSPEKAIEESNGGGGGYLVALAPHDDVVKDPTLFINTLRSFHASLGSKFQIPVIGGKELNLHTLYLEVTRRGGYDKVVNEKKWREISTVFEFSPTTTSASYALRKHYHTLLHGYEQLYFSNPQGRTGKFELNQLDNGPIASCNKTEPPSYITTGTILGKFDCGYLVSVQLGDEKLNGVIYHTSCPNASSSVPCPEPITSIVPYKEPRLPGRRTRRRKTGDPNRPKPNRSGYNFFFAEKHSMLKSQFPNREREFTKMIGESWNKLGPEERQVYQNYGIEDKERYQREMKEYKERFSARQNN